jgi:phosphonate transport system substrate-binding protein
VDDGAAERQRPLQEARFHPWLPPAREREPPPGSGAGGIPRAQGLPLTASPVALHRNRSRFSAAARACVLALTLAAAASAAAEDLTIGLIPEQNVFLQMARYRPIGAYIERRTGLEIRFTILPRYGNILDSFSSENLDGAFWGSFTGALAIRKLGIEPLARPLWLDGTSTYHGHVFVRKDSGIRTVADMEAKVIAFVERATTAGYVYPMAYLKKHGVEDLDAYFAEYYFAGSHDATIAAVLEGKADVGCAKNTIFELVAAKNPEVESQLLMLATSPNVPSNGLGLRGDLDPAVRGSLRDALLTMEGDELGRTALREFGAIRFISTTKNDYASVFEIAEAAGIDLREYEYVNE